MPKILLLISTLNTGGAQRAFANMSLAFPKEYEIDFMLNDAEEISYEYRGNIIDLGLKPQKDKTNLFYQAKVWMKRYRELKRRKGSGEYVACISALTSANIINAMIRGSKCKTIISVRNFTSKSALRGLKRTIEMAAIRKMYNRADRIVAVSEGIKEDLIDNYDILSEKVMTIYNGYNLGRITTLSKQELEDKEKVWVRDGTYTLVTAGRLCEEKGQWHLIRAMQYVRKIIPNSRLLILGEGHLENKLRELIKQYNLQDVIELCGFVRNPYKILSYCDAFVMPSLTEGFPNALVEAMCCGLPVIAADFDSGAREIIAPATDMAYKVKTEVEEAEYGILCPVCDGIIKEASENLALEEKLLAEAIIVLLKNEEKLKYYSQKSGERAEQLEASEMIKKWIELIKE